MLEQVGAVDGVHLGAEAHLARAKLLVHVVQSVSHSVHRVDDELHLPLLLVVGVLPDPLLVCNRKRRAKLITTHSNAAGGGVTRLAKQSARSLIGV